MQCQAIMGPSIPGQSEECRGTAPPPWTGQKNGRAPEDRYQGTRKLSGRASEAGIWAGVRKPTPRPAAMNGRHGFSLHRGRGCKYTYLSRRVRDALTEKPFWKDRFILLLVTVPRERMRAASTCGLAARTSATALATTTDARSATTNRTHVTLASDSADHIIRQRGVGGPGGRGAEEECGMLQTAVKRLRVRNSTQNVTQYRTAECRRRR